MTASTMPRPDASPAPDRFRPAAELVGAFRFLTRLPVPFARTVELVPLRQSMRMFGIAGAAIGAVAGLVLYWSFQLGMPSLLAATFTCALVAFVTGGLHEDGLADTLDGFGGGRDREERLAIMRDSRIGTFGTVGLILAFMFRVTAFESMLNLPLLTIVCVSAAAHAFSRAMMVDLMWASRAARSEGLAHYAGRPSRSVTLAAILTGGALPLACSFLLSPESGILALAAATMTTALIRMAATRLIGGQTGDVCGAVQVCAEISMLCAFAATNS